MSGTRTATATRTDGTGRGGTGRLVGGVVLLVAVLMALMTGLGLLVTKVFDGALAGEDGVDRSLAAHRTAPLTAVSGFWSLVGSTGVVIGVMVVVAVVFRLVFRRWRESVFLVLAVTAQALVFFVTTLLISRQRPGVPHLDASPPTSSFPSGHTGASTALYVGIAVVVAWHLRGRGLRWAAGLLVLVPLCVALSRLYRGMHHPSDVVGALLNGSLCVLLAARSVLFRVLPDGLARRLDGTSRDRVPVAAGRA